MSNMTYAKAFDNTMRRPAAHQNRYTLYKGSVMSETTGSLPRLKDQIETMIGKKPHTANILTAFTPILLEMKRLVEAGTCRETDVSSVDSHRLAGGIPVSKQTQLLKPGEPWTDLARALISAAMRGFPTLSGDLQSIEDAAMKGDILFERYFVSFPELDDTIPRDWAENLSVSPEALHVVLNSMLRTILEMKANTIVPALDDFTWDKGYCPLCGAFPQIAVIKDKISERWLSCSLCRHEWRFSRVLCPYCEHEGKEEGTTYFFIEGNDREAAFICEQCKRYVITLNRVSDLEDYDRDVVSMGLVHLDVIMQEKGYIPVAFSDWNDFTKPS